MAETRMLIGLGNPGTEYTGTRHNVGFDVIDSLARRLQIEIRKKKFGAVVGECLLQGKKVMLLKPQQYMNCSGRVVATAAGFYKLTVDDILVITDDMALEPGRIRMRKKGSSGGHNGLSDIVAALGTDQFARLRVGIGSSGQQVGRDYVLSRPKPQDRELIDKAVEISQQAALCWLEDGIDMAMNRFNVRSSD